MTGYLYINNGTIEFIESEDTPNLKELQTLVGGYIESVPAFESWTVYANEEGRIHNLPASCVIINVQEWVIYGPVVILGRVDEDGDETLLVKDVALALVTYLRIIPKGIVVKLRNP